MIAERPAAEYLTKAEAAELARVSVRTIDRWIASGRLRVGGNPRLVRIRRDWLDEALAEWHDEAAE